MPQTRPAEISDGVSLSDKDRREVRPPVAEDGAFDTDLPVSPIPRVPPREARVPFGASEHDLFAGPDKKVADFLRPGRTVVASEKVSDAEIAVFGEPPKRPVAKGSVSFIYTPLGGMVMRSPRYGQPCTRFPSSA
jgi:hypothetical protein